MGATTSQPPKASMPYNPFNGKNTRRMRWSNNTSKSYSTLYILFMDMTDDWFLHFIKEHSNKKLNKEEIQPYEKIKTMFKDYYTKLQSYKGKQITPEEFQYYYDVTMELINNLYITFELNKADLQVLTDDLKELNQYVNKEGTLNHLRRRSDPIKLALNKKRNSIASKRTERAKKQVDLGIYMARTWQVGNENDPIYKKLKGDLNAINSELSKLTTNYERNTASRNTRSSSTSSSGGKRSTRKNKSK